MKKLSVNWHPSDSAAANASRVLPKLVRKYFKAGRKFDKDSRATEMHGFRLKTKHLRYTLEAFAALFGAPSGTTSGAGFDQKLQTLRPIQNALGDLNDCNVLLNEMRDKLPDEVRSYLEKRASEKHHEFLRYWREEFDAPEEESKWEQYLKSPGTRKQTPK